MKNQKNNTRGFTLIELMVVVAIIGILASISLPRYLMFSKKAMQMEGIVFLRTIYNGEISYYGAHDSFPIVPNALANQPQVASKLDLIGIAGPYPTSKVGYSVSVWDKSLGVSNFHVVITGNLDIDYPAEVWDVLGFQHEIAQFGGKPIGQPFILINDVVLP